MPLIPCAGCGADVSSEAASCPKCGHPLRAVKVTAGVDLSDPVHVIGIIAALLLLIAIIAGVISANTPRPY
jgi:predicted amidophosphoribosyltransferase